VLLVLLVLLASDVESKSMPFLWPWPCGWMFMLGSAAVADDAIAVGDMEVLLLKLITLERQ
jgi:hypothetical protein